MTVSVSNVYTFSAAWECQPHDSVRSISSAIGRRLAIFTIGRGGSSDENTIVGVMTMRQGVRSSLCRNDRGRLLHVYACDYIRSDRRGSGIEVQGARPGPGKRLCCRGPFPDELRILLLAASAGAGNDYDSHGASDWVSIEYRYTA